MDNGGGADNWTTGAISLAKLQSDHRHQQTNIQFFYRPDALPVAQPTVSKHWKENITFHGLAYPKLTWHQRADERHGNPPQFNQELLVVRDKVGSPLPTLSLTTNSSWLHWAEGCHASHQPSDASTPRAYIPDDNRAAPTHWSLVHTGSGWPHKSSSLSKLCQIW